jgi:peptidoglycan/xylan/chitin deacetylase (PgdA/CDA1 family)
VLLAFALLLIGGGLGVDAIVLHQLGSEAPKPVPGVDVPAEVTTGGALIDARDGVRSTGVPDRTMVLTFDDGPDPTWTPRVLDVLARHGVSATFFVTAANAAKHPALVRRLISEGHEIGNHSTTHTDLGSGSATRARWELRQNQVVLAATAGRTSGLLRPPFSSTPNEVDGAVWTAIQRGGSSPPVPRPTTGASS